MATSAPSQPPKPTRTGPASGPKNSVKSAAVSAGLSVAWRPSSSRTHTLVRCPAASSPRSRLAMVAWPPLPRRKEGTTAATRSDRASTRAVASPRRATGPSAIACAWQEGSTTRSGPGSGSPASRRRTRAASDRRGMGQAGYPSVILWRSMRQWIRISPERYFVVAAVALVALTVIVFTGAAVRVTGSGLGCPHWPECYSNGRLVAELNSHAWIEFGNRMFTGFVALAAIAAGLLAFFRVPFRRDLAVLGVLLPLGVVGQAVMGGLTVLYGLAPGWVMGHYLLSMTILVAAGALAWRARPAFAEGEEPAADRATARTVWALFALGAVTIFAGTAATAAGPHAGGEGTGDVVHRFTFKAPRPSTGSSTATACWRRRSACWPSRPGGWRASARPI